MLEKYNIPATIYPVTECIEKRELPWTMRMHLMKSTDKDSIKISFHHSEKTFALTTLRETLSAIKEVKEFCYNIVPKERDEIIKKLADQLGY